MTTIEAVGLITGLITLLETGYIIGTRRARKHRASAEGELITNWLRDVVGSVRIGRLECETQRVVPGQTLSIAVTATNDARCAFEVWIGASLIHNSGCEHYDTSQDKPVVLERGTKTYHRALTVPVNAALGEYSLVIAVWLGKLGDPKHSIRLDHCQYSEIVRVGER